jgi:oligopeptide transport system substrate-binding protein
MKFNWKKTLTITATGMLMISTLAGCGAKGSKSAEGDLSDNYQGVYTRDVATLDYTYTMRNSDGMFFCNAIDGLMETDNTGKFKPAVAEEIPTKENGGISADGLTYTFKIKKGIKWVTSTGEEYAEVKAQDFVTGLKHAMDKKTQMLSIIVDTIKGVDDYMAGKVGIEGVGVKAVDDYTLQYTLKAQEPYFLTKMSYGIFWPVNEQFLNEKGADFGSTKPENILYNGPFLFSNITAKSVIEMQANPNYWDTANVHLKHLKYTFVEAKDYSMMYDQFKQGNMTEVQLDPTAAYFKDVQDKYKDNIVTTISSPYTFAIGFNFNRTAYEYTGKKDDKQKQDTKKAIMNKNFRLAFMHAFDRGAYEAQTTGEIVGAKACRNIMTPSDFVSVNGKTYGTAVSDIVSQDPNFGKIDLNDGHDAFYNKDKAAQFMAKAKEELQAEGVTFPILSYLYFE